MAESTVKCTCGVGEVFWSHLHESGCPFAASWNDAPEDPREKKIREDAIRECAAIANAAREDDGDARQIRDRILALIPKAPTNDR